MSGKHVLLGVTGSIAAYKSCDVVNSLRKAGFETKVAMSADACHFITPLTLQTLSGNKVITDMFELPAQWDVCHVSLAEWADLVLIVPASADMIAKLACGSADSIVSAAVLSAKCNILIAPAMNDNMYNHKAVQKNIAALKGLGYKFVGPRRGRLACDRAGIGHIADVSDIVRAVKAMLK